MTTPRSLAITHVRVVPMDRPGYLTDQTVLVTNGRIRAIGPASEIDLDNLEAEVIDGTGRYLMPGLADMHVHAQDPASADLYLANGITQIRNMWGRPLHLAWSKAVERGDVMGPHVATTSPIVDGPGAHGFPVWPGSYVVRTPEEAGSLVERFARRGYRQIKAYQWLTLPTLRAIGEAAGRAGIDLTGHCADGVTFEQAIGSGMRCFEHLTGIAAGHLQNNAVYPSLRDPASRLSNPDAVRLVANDLDFDALRRLAERMAAQGVWNCPTVVVWQGSAQRLSDALADPDLQYIPRGLVRGWSAGFEARARALPIAEDEWLAAARGRVDAHLRVVALLHDAGAPLLLGTDHPNPFVVPGFSIHRELANLVRAGLSPYAALRCGTIDAARFLGQSEEWGSVAVGRRADLLLLRSDPLADVGAVRQMDLVCTGGNILSREDLQRMLSDGLFRLSNPSVIANPELAQTVGIVVREGRLTERLNGSEFGKLAYRHAQLSGGDVLIEEQMQNVDSSTSRRVRIAGDGSLREGEWRTTRPDLGEDWLRLRLSDAGGYDLERQDADGYSEELRLAANGPLLAGPRLASTIVPWLLEHPHDGAQVLSLDGDDVCIAPINSTRQSDGQLELRIDHPSERVIEQCVLDSAGRLAHVQTRTWMGLRELSG